MLKLRFKLISKYLLAGLFVIAGINHFVHASLYLRIMPPYIPWHSFMVYLSGALECGLGVGLLVSRATHWAAWGLIALLIAVFPANLHMAIHADSFPEINLILLWLRLPMQALLVWWVHWHTHDCQMET